EHEHCVADLYVSTFDCMQRCRQSTTTGHKRLRCCVERNATCAGFEVDVSGPTAAEPVIESVSDAVNLSLRAACTGFADEAIPARIARAMNVEKCDAVAFVEPFAFNVEELTADLLQPTNRHVSWH